MAFSSGGVVPSCQGAGVVDWPEVAPDPYLAGVPAFAATDEEACQLQAWLVPGVGPGEVWVDPNALGIGRLPVSSFVVSAATDRLKVLGVARLQDEFVPCEGVRPPASVCGG